MPHRGRKQDRESREMTAGNTNFFFKFYGRFLRRVKNETPRACFFVIFASCSRVRVREYIQQPHPTAPTQTPTDKLGTLFSSSSRAIRDVSLGRAASRMAESARDDDVEELREQDRFLPTANINRIVKRRLPYNAKVAKDAKEVTQVRNLHLAFFKLRNSVRSRGFTVQFLLSHCAPFFLSLERVGLIFVSGIGEKLFAVSSEFHMPPQLCRPHPLFFGIVHMGQNTNRSPCNQRHAVQGSSGRGLSTLSLSRACGSSTPSAFPSHMRPHATFACDPASEHSFRAMDFFLRSWRDFDRAHITHTRTRIFSGRGKEHRCCRCVHAVSFHPI